MIVCCPQWELIRRAVAERQAARAGGGGPGALAVPGRVDAGLQGALRGAAERHQQCQVRGHLGQRPAGRVWLGDIR